MRRTIYRKKQTEISIYIEIILELFGFVKLTKKNYADWPIFESEHHPQYENSHFLVQIRVLKLNSESGVTYVFKKLFTVFVT